MSAGVNKVKIIAYHKKNSLSNNSFSVCAGTTFPAGKFLNFFYSKKQMF